MEIRTVGTHNPFNRPERTMWVPRYKGSRATKMRVRFLRKEGRGTDVWEILEILEQR